MKLVPWPTADRLHVMMLSIEPGRSRVYSNDISWRMVYQRCGLGLSYKQFGEQLNVDPSTVCRTVQLFEETETVHNNYVAIMKPLLKS